MIGSRPYQVSPNCAKHPAVDTLSTACGFAFYIFISSICLRIFRNSFVKRLKFSISIRSYRWAQVLQSFTCFSHYFCSRGSDRCCHNPSCVSTPISYTIVTFLYLQTFFQSQIGIFGGICLVFLMVRLSFAHFCLVLRSLPLPVVSCWSLDQLDSLFASFNWLHCLFI